MLPCIATLGHATIATGVVGRDTPWTHNGVSGAVHAALVVDGGGEGDGIRLIVHGSEIGDGPVPARGGHAWIGEAVGVDGLCVAAEAGTEEVTVEGVVPQRNGRAGGAFL